MNKLESYREKFEAQLKDWKSTLEMLEEKAAKATGETKADLVKAMGELRQKKTAVKAKWNELQKEGGSAWEATRGNMEKTVSELKNAFDKVVSRFK